MHPNTSRLVYEAHVRGFTREHPDVPEHQRGSFAALGHPAVIDHLRSLGVTTLQLMPVLSHATDQRLLDLGLTNHWGYAPIDVFALHLPYASTTDAESELADAVESLHASGIEVVLDVVLGHTAPRTLPANLYRDRDLSGHGNTVSSTHPVVAELVVDLLKHWRARLDIDGYRFDVAGALARDENGHPDVPGSLLARIAADDVLGSLFMVVEPWDATPEGHDLGGYAPYAEWNDRFRDDVRDFWRGRGTVRDLATALAGSSDLVEPVERSINLLTSHNGFTLRDVVSYDRKHNESNGEDGHDGTDDNRSDNLGVEGDTFDPDIIERRQARARAMLTTLLLSRGTPMLRMGDELGHTQFGNNNAHCHDSPLTWLGWEAEPGWDLREHVREIMAVRRSWIEESIPSGLGVQWLGPDGTAMTTAAWADDDIRRIGMRWGDRTLWCDAETQTAEVVIELPATTVEPDVAAPTVAMPVTRIPVLDVRPQVESGRFSVKAVVDEQFEVRARVFGEGTTAVGAAVVVTGPDGEVHAHVPMRHVGDDAWTAEIVGTEVGPWTFSIESWHDPIATWQRDARLKITAGVDVEGILAEGAALLDRIRLSDASITDAQLPPLERLDHAIALFEGEQIRDHLDATGPHPFFVDRERALRGAWYEMFPRSEGATESEDGRITPGTFATAAHRLRAVAEMGFDVVHLPPIHPIGMRGRKGRNNSLTALPGDPGSPWAVGSRDGGHDTVHPDLGTIEDFDAFVATAHDLGLEIALDLALQCSPDHPWVTAHPEWFITRADGTIAFAEDPPRRYQDIYPLTHDDDPAGVHEEIWRILEHWIDHGVRIFRVDQAHTHPVPFWQQLLGDLRAAHPDVVMLTGPIASDAMRDALAMVGFHQSHTSFMQRENPAEIAVLLSHIAQQSAAFLRPHLWVNSHDVLPAYLQSGDPAMFMMRAAMAATASPTWGMYAGYELLERRAVGRTEEHLSAEIYEIKVRDWSDPASIAPYITQLNRIRRAHPALQWLRNLTPVRTDHHRVVAFTKVRDDDIVLVVIDARPWFEDTVRVDLDLATLGLSPDTSWHDELSGIDCASDAVPIGPEHPVRILVPVPPDRARVTATVEG